MAGRDLIGQARTGSGKTLAFAVPLAERCDPSLQKVQALVLLPTRELAMQVAGVVEALASAQQIRVTLLYGGRPLRAGVCSVEQWNPCSSWHSGPNIGPSTARDP